MRIFKFFVLLIFLLASCTPRNTIVVTETFTPSLSSTPTLADLPYENTQTPFPTLTPYPTFENQTGKTYPTIQPAECPPTDPDHQVIFPVAPEFLKMGNYGEIAEQALAKGASINQVVEAFDKSLGLSGSLPTKDLTGDGIPELIINQWSNMIVIGCDQGEYKVILDYDSAIDGGWHSPLLFDVQDMNLNGIPDVILTYDSSTAWNTTVDILEWNGNHFVSLIQANHGENSPSTSTLAKSLYWYSDDWLSWYGDTNVPHMNGQAEIVIRDIDNNGTKELILTDKGPSHWDTIYSFGPWRGKQVTFEWDGLHYLYSALKITNPPEYRFQAVQDADRFFLIREYEKALELYEDVISNDELDWWSLDKKNFIRDSFLAEFNKSITPTPPQPNTEEFHSLVAYAKYRIILNYLVQNQINEASTEYNELIQDYPDGAIGSEFTEMATIFWNEFEKTNNFGQSCLGVVEYAKSYPEILSVLGDSAHGSQSHVYTPEDICPFKQPK